MVILLLVLLPLLPKANQSITSCSVHWAGDLAPPQPLAATQSRTCMPALVLAFLPTFMQDDATDELERDGLALGMQTQTTCMLTGPTVSTLVGR